MKIFSFARLKLTAWYVLIIMVVSLVFSAAIYRLQVNEYLRFEHLQRQRLEDRLEGLGPMRGNFQFLLQDNIVTEAKDRLLFRLGVANSIILIFSAGLGFFLAGKTLAPIEEMVEEQERFVSDASHELKTPLTSLRTSLEVFLREKKPTLKEASLLLEENLREVIRLQKLSESLLKLSLFGHNHYYFDRLSLKEVVEEVAARLKPLADEKKLTLTTRLQAAELSGNYDQLHELFTILIDNAVKYSPRQRGKVSVTLTARGKTAVVKVRDNGAGIPDEHLPHIFERFYRVDSARSRNGANGYGLGLAIAKQIVHDHKGQISVESKAGKGTVFTLVLPILS